MKPGATARPLASITFGGRPRQVADGSNAVSGNADVGLRGGLPEPS